MSNNYWGDDDIDDEYDDIFGNPETDMTFGDQD